jgi:hypothetical protein
MWLAVVGVIMAMNEKVKWAMLTDAQVDQMLPPVEEWLKGAINPEHKGFCSPMSKKTCTPRRKALARRFKKGGDLHHESASLDSYGPFGREGMLGARLKDKRCQSCGRHSDALNKDGVCLHCQDENGEERRRHDERTNEAGSFDIDAILPPLADCISNTKAEMAHPVRKQSNKPHDQRDDDEPKDAADPESPNFDKKRFGTKVNFKESDLDKILPPLAECKLGDRVRNSSFGSGKVVDADEKAFVVKLDRGGHKRVYRSHEEGWEPSHGEVTLSRRGVEHSESQSNDKQEDGPIEAYGVMGMDSKRWRKTFKNNAALQKWKEEHDAEVHGSRKADG